MRKFSDPEIIRAFLDFERSAGSILKAELKTGNREVFAYRKFVASLLGFLSEAEMDFVVLGRVPSNEQLFFEYFEKFSNEMYGYKAMLTARLALLGKSSGNLSSDVVISLTVDYKLQLHDRINQIRKIIEVAEFPTDKKDAIYGKIAALSKEIDKERTALGTALVAVLEISNVAGRATKNLGPLTKKIESLYKLLTSAKNESDQLQIETDEVKKIAAPEEE